MARAVLELIVSLKDQASEGLGRIGSIGMNALGVFGGNLLSAGLDAVTNSFGSLADGMIAGNAEFERYETQFGVLLGSVGAAKDRIAELAQFGAATPFELPQVVQADKILQAFGLHADDVAKRFGFAGTEIRTIAGDVAAGTGADFTEIAGYLGKFASGATGEAIARFQELGIVTRTELAEMGVQFSKSGEMTSPVDDAMDILLKSMQNKFGGMMQAQSGTFEGMMSNLEDWKAGTLRTLGAPIFEVLKDKLEGTLAFLNSPATQASLNNFANMLADGIGVAMDWLSTTAIPALERAWQDLQPAIQQTTDWLMNTALPALQQGWADLQPTIQQTVDWLTKTALPALKQGWEDLQPAIEQFTEYWATTLQPGLARFAEFTNTHILPLLDALANVYFAFVIKQLEAAAHVVTNVIGPALTWFYDQVLAPLGVNLDTIGRGIEVVIGWLNKLSEGVGAVQIPDWLQGQSPPPLADWFGYIGDAAKGAAGALPDFNAQLNVGSNLAVAAPATAGFGGISGGIVINIYGLTDPKEAAREVRRELIELGGDNAGTGI